jgi:hypothetical protein
MKRNKIKSQNPIHRTRPRFCREKGKERFFLTKILVSKVPQWRGKQLSFLHFLPILSRSLTKAKGKKVWNGAKVREGVHVIREERKRSEK